MNKILHILSINILLTTFLIGAISINTANAQTPPILSRIESIDMNNISDIYFEGRLSIGVDIMKVKYDDDATYDWYVYSTYIGNEGVRHETTPGTAIWEDSPWRNYKLGVAFNVVNPSTNTRWLVDYNNPTDVDGWTSSTQSVSVEVSSVGSATYTYTYDAPYMTVDNYSNLGTRAAWMSTHNVVDGCYHSSCTNAFLDRPSFVVRTSQNTASNVNTQYMVQWGFAPTGTVIIPSQEYWPSVIAMNAQQTGDSW